MTTPTLLPQIPTLSSLYASAIGRMVTAMIVRPMPRPLPQVVLQVNDVTADREALAGYQQLLGEPGTDELPAGFVHVLAFPLAVAVMARPDFPLPMMGMVHVRNEVTQHTPLHLSDHLTVTASARNLAPHRSGTTVELVVQVRRSGSHEVAWEGISTYLSRQRMPNLGQAPSAPRTEVTPPAMTAQWKLGAATGRRYAAVSGDRNPIHMSPVAARLFGFPRAIAHGMYTAARALATIGTARGESFRWVVDFGKPVLLPGVVSFGLTGGAAGREFVGWDAKTGKVYFSGSVAPLA